MKKIDLILLLFICFSCFGTNQHPTQISYETQSDSLNYESKIKIVISIIRNKKTPTLEEIQDVVPKTQDEYSLFYSYTYKDESFNKAFYKLSNLIFKNARNKKLNFFVLYLQLSEFVDGDYAESYFEDVDFLISSNIDYFCEIFSTLPENKVKRLKRRYLKYCE